MLLTSLLCGPESIYSGISSFISIFEHLPSAGHWEWEFSHEQVTWVPAFVELLCSEINTVKINES